MLFSSFVLINIVTVCIHYSVSIKIVHLAQFTIAFSSFVSAVVLAVKKLLRTLKGVWHNYVFHLRYYTTYYTLLNLDSLKSAWWCFGTWRGKIKISITILLSFSFFYANANANGQWSFHSLFHLTPTPTPTPHLHHPYPETISG